MLGLPAELIAYFDRIGLADSALAAPRAGFGGVEAYPDLATKAAVLCWHLVKNHPLPDGNKRCAYPGHRRVRRAERPHLEVGPGDPDETDRVIREIAEGTMSEAHLRDWIALRCT